MHLKKIISSLLVIVICCITFSSVCFSEVSAAPVTTAYIEGTGVRVRVEPHTNSTIIEQVSNKSATVLASVTENLIDPVTNEPVEYTWYQITYFNGTEQITGYVRYDPSYIRIVTYDPDAGFEEKISAFPESYRDALRALHAEYPNWDFIPDPVNLSFGNIVYEQSLNMRKQVNFYSQAVSWRSMGPGVYDWANSQWIVTNGGWTGASREIIAYYMDPRNFLNANEIYMFLQQGYNALYQTEQGLTNIVSGTFMERGYTEAEGRREVYLKGSNIPIKSSPDFGSNDIATVTNITAVVLEETPLDGAFWYKISYFNGSEHTEGYIYYNPTQSAFTVEFFGGSYLKVIMAAAHSSGVSPYIIASKIRQEIGVNDTSSLVSGKYAGYEGLYNFFNFAASGPTTTDVIVNGLTYARNMGWNSRSAAIIGGSAKYSNGYISVGQDTYYYQDFNVHNPDRLWHQYAQAVIDACQKGKNLAGIYKDQKEFALNFRIPVFLDMPEQPVTAPKADATLNNYYFAELAATGLTPSFSMYNYNYSLRVSGDTAIKAVPVTGAALVEQEPIQLKMGDNVVKIAVKAESGYTTDYTVAVYAETDCKLYVNTTGELPAPDNSQEPITPPARRGDTNGDGEIALRDLANIRLYLLDKLELSEAAAYGADTNGDGQINLRDLANVRLHLLGLLVIE